MAIVLGPNQYGKAENRIVRIYRDGERHELRDINVSTTLRGDFTDAHTVGDQSRVLPTDTQKQTAYAYAKKHGNDSIEQYALALGRHFVDDIDPVESASIQVEQYDWERIVANGQPHDHSFVRTGRGTRTTTVSVEGKHEEQRNTVVSGIKDLVVLKSTGSEFAGFLRDRYTVLEDTHDRILSTSLVARWRYLGTDADWDATFDSARAILLEQFAVVHSLALQQTLFHMGKAVLEQHNELVEVELSAPNVHHFRYNLEPFGIDNQGEVFHVDDRPYGLIEVTVQRNDAPDDERA